MENKDLCLNLAKTLSLALYPLQTTGLTQLFPRSFYETSQTRIINIPVINFNKQLTS